MNDSHPTDPLEFQEWVELLEEEWLAGQIPEPQGVAVIVINEYQELASVFDFDELLEESFN